VAQSTNPSNPAGSGSENQWATAVLSAGHYPLTTSNEEFLEGWTRNENTKAAWNPLATTQDEPGATPFNTFYGSGGSGPYHVYNYPDETTGEQATAATLAGYPDISAALASGNASQANQQGELAGDLTTWSGGSYSVADAYNQSYVSPALGGGSIANSSTATTQTSSFWSQLGSHLGFGKGGLGSDLEAGATGGLAGSSGFIQLLTGQKTGTSLLPSSAPSWLKDALPYAMIALGLIFVVIGIAVTFHGSGQTKLTLAQPGGSPSMPPKGQSGAVRRDAEAAEVAAA